MLGRRRVFVAGMGIFALASFAGGAATSPAMLVAARVLQGVGAAAFEPAALALVMTLFRDPARRNRAIGAYGAMVGLGYLAGVLLGGVLTELMGWRWVLFVNVPVALLALALAPMALASIPAGMFAGRLATRLGIKATAALGSVLLAGGLLGAARLSADGSLAIVLSGAVVAEVGFMVLSVPLTIAASIGVPESRRGLAAGLLGAATQVGGALGLGVVAAVVAATTGSPNGGVAGPEAMVASLRTGLLVCVAFVALAMLLVAALPRRRAVPRGLRTKRRLIGSAGT